MQEFVRTSPKRHTARTSIQHWQLRDLVICPQGMGKRTFAYVSANNVIAYNPDTFCKVELLRDLAFSPTCINTGCGYVAVGGQRSQIAVRNINTDWTEMINVGGSINNSICIANQWDGQTRMFICNNDETIKVYGLPSMQRVITISIPTAVNYCSVSPDGRKLAAVGDTNQVFIFDLSNENYNKISTMETNSDAGFSCAWDQSSEKLAVASQDGFVSVWDIRSSHKVATIQSHQYGLVKGACRTLKFTPSGSIDLLVFSEHVSYIDIVDARTFNNKQSIRICPEGTDSHISGLAVSSDSRKLFVGLETGILEYTIDTMSRRSFPFGSLN